MEEKLARVSKDFQEPEGFEEIYDKLRTLVKVAKFDSENAVHAMVDDLNLWGATKRDAKLQLQQTTIYNSQPNRGPFKTTQLHMVQVSAESGSDVLCGWIWNEQYSTIIKLVGAAVVGGVAGLAVYYYVWPSLKGAVDSAKAWLSKPENVARFKGLCKEWVKDLIDKAARAGLGAAAMGLLHLLWKPMKKLFSDVHELEDTLIMTCIIKRMREWMEWNS